MTHEWPEWMDRKYHRAESVLDRFHVFKHNDRGKVYVIGPNKSLWDENKSMLDCQWYDCKGNWIGSDRLLIPNEECKKLSHIDNFKSGIKDYMDSKSEVSVRELWWKSVKQLTGKVKAPRRLPMPEFMTGEWVIDHSSKPHSKSQFLVYEYLHPEIGKVYSIADGNVAHSLPMWYNERGNLVHQSPDEFSCNNVFAEHGKWSSVVQWQGVCA